MGDGHCLRDMVPFLGMVTVEATNVVLNVLFKSATSRGMSVYVFIVYSYAVATLILFPLLFIFNRKRLLLPPFKFSLLCKICSLGFIGFLAEIVAYKGIDYSSPTLASVVGNLTPALTFMLAIFFRFPLSSSSSSNLHCLSLFVPASFSLLGCLCNCNCSLSLHPWPYHRK